MIKGDMMIDNNDDDNRREGFFLLFIYIFIYTDAITDEILWDKDDVINNTDDNDDSDETATCVGNEWFLITLWTFERISSWLYSEGWL